MTDLSSLVLGLDCSTTACKAIVWDCRGNAVAKGVSPLALSTPQPALHEQPAEDWWTATVEAIRQAVSRVDGSRLAALCIAHQRETFVPVDEQGLPLTHGILWLDERASGLLPKLEHSFGSLDFHRLTGKRLSVNLTIAKIAWLRENRPDIFNRICKYLDVHSFLVHRLTGFFRTGWGCADPTGMFDIQNHCWAETLLSQAGLRLDQLPEVYSPGTVVGTSPPTGRKEMLLAGGFARGRGLATGRQAAWG